MSDPKNPNPPPTPSTSTSTKSPNEINNGHANANTSFNGQKVHFPNPPDPTNPDPATLREQWRFAIKQYSRWYSHAWGTAILAGVSFFALGWIIKGSNPLPSFRHDDNSSPSTSSSSSSSSSSSVDDTHKPHHS